MIKGSGSYINPLARTIRGRTSGAAAAGEAASMAEAMAKGRSKAPVSQISPAAEEAVGSAIRNQKPMPAPEAKPDSTSETYSTLPYRVPDDSGMPKYNNAPKLLRDLEPSFDARAADEMRGVMRKSVQPPAGMRGAIEEAQTVGPSGGSFDFSRMSDMVDRIRQPDREYSYKRGGYVSKDNKLNLGSGRVSTASKGKKSSNW